MSEKVKLSKDGSSIDFVQSESLPTSLKKFRQSPEIEGFYRFIFENDLQKEAYEILDRIINERKAKRQAEKKEMAALKKEATKKENKETKEKAQASAAQTTKQKAAKPAKITAQVKATPAKSSVKASSKATPKASSKPVVKAKSGGKKPAAAAKKSKK